VIESADESSLFDIISGCKEGDHYSFRELYDMYKDRVYTTSRRMLGNSDDAEDAAQEIFLKIFHNIKKFRGDSSLLTWIYRITVNTCIECIRKRRKNHESLDDSDDYSSIPAPSGTDGLARLILEREIDHLPEGCKTVFLLHTVEGFTHNEIGEILNIPTGTSKSQLAAAKSRLREQLLPYMEVLRHEL